VWPPGIDHLQHHLLQPTSLSNLCLFNEKQTSPLFFFSLSLPPFSSSLRDLNSVHQHGVKTFAGFYTRVVESLVKERAVSSAKNTLPLSAFFLSVPLKMLIA